MRQAIEQLKFRKDTPHGFATFDSTEFSLENFRFLWRTRVPVFAVDDDGTALTQLVDGVEFTDFAVARLGGIDFLRIENPGRSVRDLLNSLETAFGLGFSAEPVKFESKKPTTLFSSVSASKLVGLKVIGALPPNGVVARMEFASKDGMDPLQLQALSSLDYRVESALYEIFIHGLRGQVSFSANGLVKVSAQLGAKIVDLIEEDLPNLSE